MQFITSLDQDEYFRIVREDCNFQSITEPLENKYKNKNLPRPSEVEWLERKSPPPKSKEL